MCQHERSQLGSAEGDAAAPREEVVAWGVVNASPSRRAHVPKEEGTPRRNERKPPRRRRRGPRTGVAAGSGPTAASPATIGAMSAPFVLFCSDPSDPRLVDSAYEPERAALESVGGAWSLFSFEALVERNAPDKALRRFDFFTMDIAERADGSWMIIELGDGQVAGLPERLLPVDFYRALASRWSG